MLRLHPAAIYLHREPVDFRQSINGLTALVQNSMSLDVFAPSLFVFGNRRRTAIKMVFWDRTGFCLVYKRLERDRFKWPRRGDSVWQLTAEQFDWLWRGLDISRLTPHAEKYFTSVA